MWLVKRIKWPLLSVLFCLACPFSFARSIFLIDDLGAEVLLSQPAKSIVLLGPNLVESAFAIAAADAIIGVSEYSDYPLAAKKIPRVASYNTINYEQILASKPDLIVIWASGFGADKIQKLRDLGLTVFASEPQTLADIGQLLRTLGILTGHVLLAEQAATDYEEKLAQLARQYRQQRPVSVFYQIGHQPMQTLNGQHIVSDVIRLCGGINVFAEQPEIAPKVTIEAVIAVNPEVIMAGVSDQKKPAWFDDWYTWPMITAVKKNQLFIVNSNTMVRHAPRILEGAKQLCHFLDQVRSSVEVNVE